MKNLSFNQFLLKRENDGNQQPIAGGFELPYNQDAGKDQGPSDEDKKDHAKQGAQAQDHDEDAVVEETGNQIRKIMQKLVKINPQEALNLLSVISSEISNTTGQSANANNSKEGLRTNSEPSSPPMQPQASG